jgi:adenosylhomocysteine nucleosidase
MPEPRIALIAALKQELAALRDAWPAAGDDGVLLDRCGVGPHSAGAFTRALVARHPSLRVIVSCGVCGALDPELPIGAVVLATALGSAEHSAALEPVALDLSAVRAALESHAAKTPGTSFAAGGLISAAAVACTPPEKAALRARFNALAVDMETFGMRSASGGRPVFALRTVSDRADDALPPETAGFLDPAGNLRTGRVARFVLTQPHRLGALIRLGKHTSHACTTLTAAIRAAQPALRALAGS